MLTSCTDVPILPERDETGTKGFYKPIIFPNDFWHLRSQYVEINTTTPRLPLEITFQPMSYWKFQLFATMTYSFAEAAKQQGATGGAEMDEIKRMLVETNPYFLGLTGLVSILHVLYVLLAVFIRGHCVSNACGCPRQLRVPCLQLRCFSLEEEAGAHRSVSEVSRVLSIFRGLVPDNVMRALSFPRHPDITQDGTSSPLLQPSDPRRNLRRGCLRRL